MVDRLNIVVITGHDFGRALGCYGKKTVVSPEIDEWASDSVICDNAYAAAPTCSPSRAAMHTGLYPHGTGLLGFPHDGWRLNAETKHLAHILREAGYLTVLAGFQHLVPPGSESRLGFEIVLPDSSGDGRLVTDAVVEFVRNYRDDRPLYLEIGFHDAHTDWMQFPESGFGGEERSQGVEIPGYLPQAPDVESYLAGHQYGVRQLDSHVGRVLGVLKETGLDTHSWTILAADHGIPITRAKATLYDAGLEIALVMRCPSLGLIGGSRIDAFISNVDVVPTILDGLGLRAPSQLHGRSFLESLTGGGGSERTAIFAEQTFCDDYAPMRCIRTLSHKLIYNAEEGYSISYDRDARVNPAHRTIQMAYLNSKPHFELYDIIDDPNELSNLYGSADTKLIAAELKQQLRAVMEGTHDPILAGPIGSPFYYEGRRELLGANESGNNKR